MLSARPDDAVEAVGPGDFIACVADPTWRDASKRKYDFFLMRVVSKFVLMEDKVDAETNEVEYMAGETLLEVDHFMYGKAHDKGSRGAEQRVWEPTPGGEARGFVSSTTVICGKVTVEQFKKGGHVVKGAAALVTVSRDEHNCIVEMRNDLNELVM